MKIFDRFLIENIFFWFVFMMQNKKTKQNRTNREKKKNISHLSNDTQNKEKTFFERQN